LAFGKHTISGCQVKHLISDRASKRKQLSYHQRQTLKHSMSITISTWKK